jgi:sortase A
MRRIISTVLFFFGGIAIGIWLWSMAREALEQRRDAEIFDRQRQSPPPPRSPAAAAPKFSRGELVGRLVIQRIHLQASVREGDDDDTLAVALGHIPGTALPGENGNVGVAGHRDRLFRHLGELARNDEIQLQTPSAAYIYMVDNMAIVKPNDVSVLKPARRGRLTLVTCYPFHYIGAAPERYIVEAHLIAENLSTSAKAVGRVALIASRRKNAFSPLPLVAARCYGVATVH